MHSVKDVQPHKNDGSASHSKTFCGGVQLCSANGWKESQADSFRAAPPNDAPSATDPGDEEHIQEGEPC